jgi:hypothetical protein
MHRGATVLLLLALASPDEIRQAAASASLPDMTGKWALINAAEAPAGSARNLQIVQDERTFSVVSSDGHRPAPGGHTIGIVGGSVSGLGDPNPWRTEHSAIVRDGALVIESTRYFSDSAGEHSVWRSEVWSLKGDRLTIRFQERQDDRRVPVAPLVYRRSGTPRE